MTRAELHSRGDTAVSQLEALASCPTCLGGSCWKAEHSPEERARLALEAARLLRAALGRE